MEQLNRFSRLEMLAGVDHFNRIRCAHCWDSHILGISNGVIVRCHWCAASRREPGASATQILRRFQRRLDENLKCEYHLVEFARALAISSSQRPVLGACLQSLFRISARTVKANVKRLRDEWALPVCGSRDEPFGYYIAATPEEFLAWMRTTRAQAISELATAWGLFRHNFPELAGQQQLFINECANDLEEAMQ